MEPALALAVGFLGGYFLARNNDRWLHRHAYDIGYQQALNDVANHEDELVEQIREQASLN